MNGRGKQELRITAFHPKERGVNPISYCNLLFSGSIVAFVTLTLLRPRNLMPSVLTSYPPKIWILALLSAGLAGGIAPILLLEALAKTSVTSVVLMQTVEIPLVLAFAWIFLRENQGGKALIGGAIALAGVVLTSWSGNGAHLCLGPGELLALTGTVAAVLATQLGRGVVEQMSPVLFGTIRNLFGMLLFAAIVLWFFGPSHFTDVLSPYLWAWTLLYGSVIVVLGQLTWLGGLSSVKAADIALAASFTPVAGVFFAWVILGEHPTRLQLAGGLSSWRGSSYTWRGTGSRNLRHSRGKKTPPDRYSGVSDTRTRKRDGHACHDDRLCGRKSPAPYSR